jgi:toxin ParE1/3/4
VSAGWRWRPKAEADATEIWNWIAAESPDSATEMLDRFEDVARSLTQFPDMGRDRSDLLLGLRCFPVGDYLMFYQRVGGHIEIVRVIHGRRDITAVLF